MKLGNKGSFGAIIPAIVALIIISAILALQSPILGGIITAATPSNATATWGAAMAGANSNITNGVANGAIMEGIIPTVAAGVILLMLLMVLSKKN